MSNLKPENRSIHEIVKGDYVKTGHNKYEKIELISGVSADGRLAKPSEGGFSVTTESGKVVSMWNAKSYHKASDIEKK